MSENIEISNVVKGIEIEAMVVKPVRGVTENDKTIIEDNLQLKLRNNGNKIFTYIGCNLEYFDEARKTVGFDGDVTLYDVKPTESCLMSIPMVIPNNTKKMKLEITGESEYAFNKYSTWLQVLFLLILVILIFYTKYAN